MSQVFFVPRVINYFDVWGNKKDGFEVNNMCEFGQGEWHTQYDLDSKVGILAFLKGIDFCKKYCRTTQIHVEWCEDFAEISTCKKHGYKPVCRIEYSALKAEGGV